jgi:hypothetical protein
MIRDKSLLSRPATPEPGTPASAGSRTLRPGTPASAGSRTLWALRPPPGANPSSYPPHGAGELPSRPLNEAALPCVAGMDTHAQSGQPNSETTRSRSCRADPPPALPPTTPPNVPRPCASRVLAYFAPVCTDFDAAPPLELPENRCLRGSRRGFQGNSR